MTEVTGLAALAAAPVNPQAPKPDRRYTLRYGSARTGRVFGSLPASSGSGSSGLNGDGSVNIGIGSGQSQALYRRVSPGYTSWLLEWRDGSVRALVDGGVLWNDDAEVSWSLNGAGLLSLLNKRLLIPDQPAPEIPRTWIPPGKSPEDIDPNPLVFYGLDTGSIMRAVVAQAMVMPHGDLPITLQPSRAGTRQQIYHGYDLGFVGPRLTELAGQDPLTEFTLDPRYTDDTHQFATFDLITGTEAAPKLTKAVPHRLNGTTPGQQVLKKVKASRSATDMGTDAYAAGDGDGPAKVVQGASDDTLTGGGWPRMDVVEDNDSADPVKVQAYANGIVSRRRFPLRGITVTVDAGWWWANGRKGDPVHLTTVHPVMGPLDLTSRVLEVSWDITSSNVDLTLADTTAEEAI